MEHITDVIFIDRTLVVLVALMNVLRIRENHLCRCSFTNVDLCVIVIEQRVDSVCLLPAITKHFSFF